MASTAASAKYRNTCPTCKSGPFMPCRTLKSGRVTGTHIPRLRAVPSRKVRIIPPLTPDPLISYVSNFLVAQEVVTQSALDTLYMLGYSRSKSIAVLTDN